MYYTYNIRRARGGDVAPTDPYSPQCTAALICVVRLSNLYLSLLQWTAHYLAMNHMLKSNDALYTTPPNRVSKATGRCKQVKS